MNPWAIVLAELFKALLGVLSEWLEREIEEAALRLPPPTPDTARASEDLLREVRGSLWFWEVRRKKYVDWALSTVPRAMAQGRAPTLAEKAVGKLLVTD